MAVDRGFEPVEDGVVLSCQLALDLLFGSLLPEGSPQQLQERHVGLEVYELVEAEKEAERELLFVFVPTDQPQILAAYLLPGQRSTLEKNVLHLFAHHLVVFVAVSGQKASAEDHQVRLLVCVQSDGPL